jgi:hypothetical protein
LKVAPAGAISQGFGEERDLARIEEGGQMRGAKPEHVSDRAKERQRREMGTLGSGNHYLEVQAVAEIFDQDVARQFGLKLDDLHQGVSALGIGLFRAQASTGQARLVHSFCACLEGRDAPPGLSRTPHRQEGDRRDEGNPQAWRGSKPLIEIKDPDVVLS